MVWVHIVHIIKDLLLILLKTHTMHIMSLMGMVLMNWCDFWRHLCEIKNTHTCSTKSGCSPAVPITSYELGFAGPMKSLNTLDSVDNKQNSA